MHNREPSFGFLLGRRNIAINIFHDAYGDAITYAYSLQPFTKKSKACHLTVVRSS
jgi:hypothetical protein